MSRSGIPVFHVDAFTDRPFAGNPAAVCLLERPRAGCDERWMQAVAREMNLSETAFIDPRADGYGLRWFTPAVEVDLCGHATLAGAHVLWASGRLPENEPARFHTRSGLLTATRDGDLVVLDFPAAPCVEAPVPVGLFEALGVEGTYRGQSATSDHLVEMPGEDIVRRLAPDFTRLREVDARGVIVTSRPDGARGDCDFVSRFFAPQVGIDEDPVTGSAHCSLGPYWADRLGREELVGLQVSSRGGRVGVRVRGDRVFLSGQAVTIMTGRLEDHDGTPDAEVA